MLQTKRIPEDSQKLLALKVPEKFSALEICLI